MNATPMRTVALDDPTLPIYTIGQVADLLGTGQATLRRFEQLSLVAPERSRGHHRRYSRQDVEALHEVVELSHQGVGTVGIKLILDLRARVDELEDEVRELRMDRDQGQRGAS